MRVFVTGATGFVGSAIVRELLGAGHQVLGLARSDAAVRSLASVGVDVHRGSLEDLDSLRSGAEATDAVIHTAFIHDFSKFEENCGIDKRAIETLGGALAGSGRPLIVTSALGLLAPGILATEDFVSPADSPVPRVSDRTALSMLPRGVRVSVVRLPPSVHGDGKSGFVAALIGIAREKGISAYIGEGLNRWPAVHLLDAARLYRLVLEKGAAGALYHAVAEEGILLRDIAAVISRRLNVPLVSRTREEAADHFGWFAPFAAMDAPSSSEKTRGLMGWKPTQPGLLADIDDPGYFEPQTK